jgi:hypothetical protein
MFRHQSYRSQARLNRRAWSTPTQLQLISRVRGMVMTLAGAALLAGCVTSSNNAETLIDRVSCKGWSERRISLKLKAMQSIMKRDLRLSIMGKSYSNELKNRIFSSLFPDIPSGWKACVEAFSKYGVIEKRLLQYFKVFSAAEVTTEILFNALGIYDFMRENGSDVNEIFGAESQKPNIKASDIKVEENKRAVKKPMSSKTNGKVPSGQSDSKAPTVMGADEFSSLVESLALQAGITVADGLKECAGVDCVEDVLPEAQSKIVDWFTARAEQPGA